MSDVAVKTCFVIMPFRVRDSYASKYVSKNHWTEVYEGLIRPAVKMAGFVCERDDVDIGSRLISESILLKIEQADLILCDLSTSNPNVFLELGWTLRTDKQFILIKDNLTQYEFDLNQYYTFEYDHTLQPIALGNNIQKLADVIKQTYKDDTRRYSLVKRLSVSLSAIEAASKGDETSALMLEIRDKLLSPSIRFPQSKAMPMAGTWPSLIQYGLECLYGIKEKVSSADVNLSSNNLREITTVCTDIVSRLGIRHERDIQFSLIDGQRFFVFHDRDAVVGGKAVKSAKEGFDIYDEVFRYSAGAVAWTDIGTNVPGKVECLRHNVGLWTTPDQSTWRFFIELHQEMDS